MCEKALKSFSVYLECVSPRRTNVGSDFAKECVCVCVLIVIQYMYDTLVMSLSIHWDMGNASFPFRIAGHSVPIQLINKLG